MQSHLALAFSLSLSATTFLFQESAECWSNGVLQSLVKIKF